MPEEDWRFASLSGAWADTDGGSGAPGAQVGALAQNPQVRLAVHGQQRGRFFVMVQSNGVGSDLRAQAGMQAAPDYPALGLAVASGAEGGATLAALRTGAHVVAAEVRDGVVLECELEPSVTCAAMLFTSTPNVLSSAAPFVVQAVLAAHVSGHPRCRPYVVMPYLQDPAAALGTTPGLGYTISVFSDVEFQLGGGGGSRDNCGYEHCCFCGKSCALFAILQRLKKIEAGVDTHFDRISTLRLQ